MSASYQLLSDTAEKQGLFSDRSQPLIEKITGSWNLILSWTITLSLLAGFIIDKSRTRAGFAYRTDFDPAKPSVSLHEVRFTSGLKYDENGTLFLSTHAGDTQYVGKPSPSLDRAWDELIGIEVFHLTEDEGEHLAQKTNIYRDPRGYLAGLEVFHSLHCLNYVRKSFYLDSYPEIDDETHITHRDHCMEAVRQTLMCGGDLTPIPNILSPTARLPIPDFEQLHVCRDYSKMSEWLASRVRLDLGDEPPSMDLTGDA